MGLCSMSQSSWLDLLPMCSLPIVYFLYSSILTTYYSIISYFKSLDIRFFISYIIYKQSLNLCISFLLFMREDFFSFWWSSVCQFFCCCVVFCLCVCVMLGNVQPTLVGDVNNRRLDRVGCRVYISSQFCHEPTMTVKIKSLKIAKVNHHLIK